jgi:hypothetical protein
MNLIILKQATVLSLILGAIIALVALIGPLMIYAVLALAFACAPLVIIYMKKQRMLGILDTQQGATLSAAIGCAASAGFFMAFIPLVLIISLIFKDFYTYGIPYFMNLASFWLLIVILAMLAITLAATNAVVGMGVVALYNHFGPRPEGADEGSIDIKVE